MNQTPDLTPVAVREDTDHGIVIRITFPHAGVDRPHSFGIGVTAKNAPRLIKAVNAGAVTANPHILTDINGNTYVGFTSTVMSRYINVDLQRLGY